MVVFGGTKIGRGLLCCGVALSCGAVVVDKRHFAVDRDAEAELVHVGEVALSVQTDAGQCVCVCVCVGYCACCLAQHIAQASEANFTAHAPGSHTPDHETT